MNETSQDKIQAIFEKQQQFYHTHATKPIGFRKAMLIKLQKAIQTHEKEISEALWEDLHKSYEEAYLTEIGIVYTELKHHLHHVKSWSKSVHIFSPLVLQPSSSKIIKEPLGLALIVSPWNYPFQLVINPLIGAISAGNCAIIKPSPDASNVAKAIEKMISATFDENYIACIQGGKETNEHLFDFPFDVVFFTGSSKVGSIFMENFAQHLSKVVLELGGKSPCVVDKNANIETAARRIVWGKTINSGQTCIAPDYLLVHASIKEKLVQHMQSEVEKMFGTDMQQSDFYARMIHEDAFDRVSTYLKDGNVILGGKTDKSDKFIEFTVLDKVNPESDVMQTEIFGPILPMITFEDIQEVFGFVQKRPKPLAFYYFGKSKNAKEVLQKTTSGGACINDTLMHIVNHKMPFGGVGNSGLGNYHGKFSFEAFSHNRAVVSTPTWIDLPLKYAPYKFFDWIKKFM